MASSPGKVTGLETVMRNLNREVLGIKGRTLDGLYEAGLQIQGAAQRRVPVDTGNLKASAFTRKDRQGRPRVEVGFTSAYAVFVHENTEMKLKGLPHTSGTRKGRYWDPQGRAGPKFLQNAVADNAGKIVAIVARRARVPR